MAPTESQILTSFLLPPAPLPTTLSLSKFTSLFPSSQQNDHSIPALYRELQSQKDEDISNVRHNIAAECQRGIKQAREMKRERQKIASNEDSTIHSSDSTKPQSQPAHTTATLQAVLTSTIQALDSDVAALEAESAQLLEEMKATVGDLSDLRYGRFQKTPGSKTELRDEILDSLRRVKEGAEEASSRNGRRA